MGIEEPILFQLIPFQYRGVTIDGREVGGKSSSSYELSSFARDRSAGPQVRKSRFIAIGKLFEYSPISK